MVLPRSHFPIIKYPRRRLRRRRRPVRAWSREGVGRGEPVGGVGRGERVPRWWYHQYGWVGGHCVWASGEALSVRSARIAVSQLSVHSILPGGVTRSYRYLPVEFFLIFLGGS